MIFSSFNPLTLIINIHLKVNISAGVFSVLTEYIMFKDKLVLSFTKKIIGNQNLYITNTNVDSQ